MTQENALEIMKTGESVFLTGAPGAGKTYVLNQYINWLYDHGIRVAVTASTGIAATHIGGSTIHSWSGIGIKSHLSDFHLEEMSQKQYLNKNIKGTEVLVIDEVSMLSGVFIDMVDLICRTIRQNENPFGGLQVILTGDMFQLPPVGRFENGLNYAFKSNAWNNLNPAVCYLTTQFRQEDDSFLAMLDKIRTGNISAELMDLFRLARKIDSAVIDPVQIFTHNIDVDSLNSRRLAEIKKPEVIFEMSSVGRKNFTEKLIKSCLSPEQLRLKLGATVMFTKNNFDEGYVNGTTGVVIGFAGNEKSPVVRTKKGIDITVTPATWEIIDDGKSLASITQLPLRLAWAITVHKSQGMSIDHAEVDLSKCFEYGQGYVALSRVRTLSGLKVSGLNEKALQVDPEIIKIDEIFRERADEVASAYSSIDKNLISKMQKDFILRTGGVLDPAKKKSKPAKLSTYSITLQMVKKTKPIKEIAKERNLTPDTIIGHIEKLLEKGDLSISEIEYIKYGSKLRPDEFDVIAEAFFEADSPTLSPIKNKFKDKYSFTDLRLARLFTA